MRFAKSEAASRKTTVCRSARAMALAHKHQNVAMLLGNNCLSAATGFGDVEVEGV